MFSEEFLNRRKFLSNIGVALAGTSILSENITVNNLLAQNKKNNDKPNILFIFLDDLGWADLPMYGYQKVVAPAGYQIRSDIQMSNFERLTREGTLFTQFYVAAPTCTPSRVGILTGQYPSRLKMYAPIISNLDFNTERGIPSHVDVKTPTVMKALKENDYKIGHFGKWHIGITKDDKAPFTEKYGVDKYRDCRHGPDGRQGSTKMIADEAIQFMTEHKDESFYINAWLYDPHSPLCPTDDETAPYSHLSTEKKYQGALEIWNAVMSRIDKHIGRMLDHLDKLGLAENTIVIFSSDNGPESSQMPFTSHYGGATSIGSGPFRGIKRSLYEGGIREPFIIRWPGNVKAGHVDNQSIISAVDYLPSICAVTGSNLPELEYQDGEDLSDIFYGKPIEKQKPIMWDIRFPVYGRENDKSPRLAIRDKQWKLLMNPDSSRIELYDIIKDPGEVDNLANEYPDVVKDLSNQMIQWYQTLPESPVHKDAGCKTYVWPKND